MKEAGDLLKGPALPPQIDGEERIAVTGRLDAPLLQAIAAPRLAIEARQGSEKPQPALKLRKPVDDELEGKGVRAQIRAPAEQLNHPAAIPQQEMLRPIDRLQQGAPAWQIAKREKAAKTGGFALAHIGGQNA